MYCVVLYLHIDPNFPKCKSLTLDILCDFGNTAVLWLVNWLVNVKLVY